MSRASRLALAVAASVLVSWLAAAPPASAKTQFFAYDGPNAVREGGGGAKKVVDGVEFWIDGAPPHRFQILGSIQDARLRGGILGAISMSNLEHDIARRARAAGGDAVILSDAHDHVFAEVGSSVGGFSIGGGGFGGSVGFGEPIARHTSLYTVVRYLPDAPQGPSEPPPILAPPVPPPAGR
ncbi:MAG: hypothetical protein JO127_01015 [Caulobacteraceae bacterium]|nr:hypothetical protein [Caulobacteraceae bacterium]